MAKIAVCFKGSDKSKNSAKVAYKYLFRVPAEEAEEVITSISEEERCGNFFMAPDEYQTVSGVNNFLLNKLKMSEYRSLSIKAL